MNLIKELSEKHPIAWKAFNEWGIDNYSHHWDIIEYPDEAQERYLLADLQAWLDSVGRHCDAFFHYPTNEYGSCVNVGDTYYGISNQHEARPEALKASVFKGCEIYETQNQ